MIATPSLVTYFGCACPLLVMRVSVQFKAAEAFLPSVDPKQKPLLCYVAVTACAGISASPI